MLPSMSAASRRAWLGLITARRWRRLTGRAGSGVVPHDPTLQVHTAWDLGIGDLTAIWLIQIAGRELHAIDYIEM